MYIFYIIILIIVGVLIFAATKPNTFRVERKLSMKATPEMIFPLINDFHTWASWSPYEKLDPNMKKTYSGSEKGKGAVYEWSGTGKVGTGRMEILETIEPSKISIKLDFIKPFEGHNIGEFTMEPKGDMTEVTWSMHGPSAYMSKVMGLFMNMDNMIGKDFEAGLANLKTLAEK